MELIPVLAIVLAVSVAVLFGLVVIYRPRHSDQKRAREWVKSVEKAKTIENVVGYGPLKIDTRTNQKPLANAKRQHVAEAKFADAWKQFKTSEFAEAHRAATEPADVAKLCLDVFGQRAHVDAEAVFGIPESRLGLLFREAMGNTLTQARRRNIAALEDYMRVVDDPRLQEFCSTYKVKPPVYPRDWNDIVMESVDHPSLYHFKGIRRLPLDGAEILAAKALIDRDLKMAKLLLAYCKEQQCEHNQAGDGKPAKDCSCKRDYPYRDAVGNHLWTELLMMLMRATRASTG